MSRAHAQGVGAGAALPLLGSAGGDWGAYGDSNGGGEGARRHHSFTAVCDAAATRLLFISDSRIRATLLAEEAARGARRGPAGNDSDGLTGVLFREQALWHALLPLREVRVRAGKPGLLVDARCSSMRAAHTSPLATRPPIAR